MLLNSVEATSSRGSVLSFPLNDFSNGFVVQNIEGLGPVKATLVSTSFANMDGEQYHSSRREARDIKLTLGLEPDYSTMDVQGLRDQLYNFFMPKSSVHLAFKSFDRFSTSVLDQWRTWEIDGVVESCEPSMFTKDPAIDISIHCFNPDLYDATSILQQFVTAPLDSDSDLQYDGTVDTGVLFTLFPNQAMSDFSIYHRLPDNSLKTADISLPLLSGDILKINSVRGSKSIILTRNGVDSSVLYAQSPQSAWIELQPGLNQIRVWGGTSGIPYQLEYTNKYGGL